MASPIAAIEARLLDDPSDEGAWRCYAPWLRAQGDPRGEWIALEAFADTAAERAWLAARLAEQHARWTPLALWAEHCTFRRGFVVAGTMHIAGRSDARRLADLMRAHDARLLGELRLVFADRTPPRGLAALAEAALDRLRVLRAGEHGRGNRVARALASQPTLNLRVLDLRRSGLTDEGLVALAGSPALGRLRALHLQQNLVTARGVAALAASPALAGLELLDLRHNPLGADGAAALAASPHLDSLTALHLHAGELGAAGVRALASSTTLPHDLVRLWRAQDAPR